MESLKPRCSNGLGKRRTSLFEKIVRKTRLIHMRPMRSVSEEHSSLISRSILSFLRLSATIETK